MPSHKESSKTREYSDEEIEHRATDALRRALTTPYQPQKVVAKKAKQARKSEAKGRPKSA
jgi:hypothetical protein